MNWPPMMPRDASLSDRYTSDWCSFSNLEPRYGISSEIILFFNRQFFFFLLSMDSLQLFFPGFESEAGAGISEKKIIRIMNTSLAITI